MKRDVRSSDYRSYYPHPKRPPRPKQTPNKGSTSKLFGLCRRGQGYTAKNHGAEGSGVPGYAKMLSIVHAWKCCWVSRGLRLPLHLI